MPQPPTLLSIGQAAAITGLSTDTLRRYANADLLPCTRTPGGQRRFRREDVERLVLADAQAEVSS